MNAKMRAPRGAPTACGAQEHTASPLCPLVQPSPSNSSPAVTLLRLQEPVCHPLNEVLLRPGARRDHQSTCQGQLGEELCSSGDPRLTTEPRREARGQTELLPKLMDFWEQKSLCGGTIWGFASSAGGSLSQSIQAEE